MDYLADRVKKLKIDFSDIEWDKRQKDFITRLFEVLEDCAVITDDLVDAADEFEMRISDLEDK